MILCSKTVAIEAVKEDTCNVVGNEFEPVDIAPLSVPPELPEVMKTADVSTANTPKPE